MKILFASHNKDKIEEMKKILSDVDLVSLEDLKDNDEVDEDGETLKDNARKKAEYFFKKYHVPTFSDDTGLFVEALGGAPGVHSARYSASGTYIDNVTKLISEMKGKANRKAYFETTICYIDDNALAHYFTGHVDGDILDYIPNVSGFGYDPVFKVTELNKTYTEMGKSEKNKVSHRGLAVEKFHTYLRQKVWNDMILFFSNDILGRKDSKIVKRLMGGMSNYTYVVSSNDELYTIRFIGEYAEEFVDRKQEALNIKLVEDLNITNKTIYFDITSGLKMARFIDGTPLSEMDPKDYPLDKVSDVLKVLHNSGKKAELNYDPFKRLEKYEKLLTDDGYRIPKEYYDIKKAFLSYKDYLESQEMVLCHGDSQPSNFILGDKLYIVDFEFTGNCDPIYDIACFSNMRLEDGMNLLKEYYKDDLDNDKWKRFYLWRGYQAAQWFNVAMFKHLKGMSETLKIPFEDVAFSYLQLFEKMINKANEL